MNLKEEIDRILELVRLSKEEKEKYIEHFSKMVEFFKKIGELDLKNEKPFFYLEHLKTELRKDNPEEFKNKELIRKNSPEFKGNFFITESPIE